MSEIDESLARQLRDLYERIERRRLPASLGGPDLAAIKRGRPAKGRLTRIAGFAAVVAAAGAFLVVGLASHLSSTNRTPGGGATATLAASPTPSSTPSATVSATPSPSASAGPTAGWPLLSSTSGGFLLHYPTGWQVDGPCVITNPYQRNFFPPAQGPIVEVRLGPTTTSSCGTQVFQNVMIDSYVSGAPPVNQASCQLVSTQPVTIGGVNGQRIVSTPDPTVGSCGVPSIVYQFQVGQRIYLVSYYHDTGYPDLTSQIDTMMTQTWSFLPAG